MIVPIKANSIILYILLYLFINSCNSQNEVQEDGTDQIFIINSEFQNILDSTKLTGSILVLNANTSTYYSNDFKHTKIGQLPASTYKIPNSIIALETGIVESDETILPWDGENRLMDAWEKDLTFKQAFHRSCVPCYQQIARTVGSEKMMEFIHSFDYGEMDIHSENIDQFWLLGESKISPMEQVQFLYRFYNQELPISKTSFNIMKKMMVIDALEEYTLSGKTGWSRDGKENGWFVGQMISGENIWYFATNVEPKESFNLSDFAKIRKEVTLLALRSLNANT